MERDEQTDANAFLKNYFRLVAGFTSTHGPTRPVDDRLHDLSGFVQQQQANIGPTSPLNLPLAKAERNSFDASAANAFLSQHQADIRKQQLQKSIFAGADITANEYFAALEHHTPPQNQRRHSLESITALGKSTTSSIISSLAMHSSAFPQHSSNTSSATTAAAPASPLPSHVTAAQLCRWLWNETKSRTLRCGICMKNIVIGESAIILQHAKLHCDFESFECLLCHGNASQMPPYRTNKYQVMYGHMKSAHRGRMIMNETWRRLTPAEIQKIDDQLIASASARLSIHDDPEEDRKIRDVVFQCFGEYVDLERLAVTAMSDLGEAQLDNRRENGNYYYHNEKPSIGNYRGTTTLALPLAAATAPYSGGNSAHSDTILPTMRDHSASFSYSQNHYHHHSPSQLLHQRQSAAAAAAAATAALMNTAAARRGSLDELEFRHATIGTTSASKDDRAAALEHLIKAQQQSRKNLSMAASRVEPMDFGSAGPDGAAVLEYGRQLMSTNAPSSYLMRQNRARKRVSGGSRSLPALETINQLCQQLRNEASYYDGERSGGGHHDGATTNSSNERRPRIWCHLCQKAIELPEAASRYMTEHVASAHTTLKLFCCATCPYEAKTYTQVKAHIKNHHPTAAMATLSNGANMDEKYTSLKDTFTVKEPIMIPLLKACFLPNAENREATVGLEIKSGHHLQHLVHGHREGFEMTPMFQRQQPKETNYGSVSSSLSNSFNKVNKNHNKSRLVRKKVNGFYKCPRCAFQSSSRDELSRHRRTTWCAYTWPNVHACPLCRRFTTRFGHILDRHLERVHNMDFETSATSRNYC